MLHLQNHSLPLSLPFSFQKRSTNSTCDTIENLKQANITGDKNIGKVTDGVAEGIGGQLDSDGLLGKVGDMTSKEGMNRAERGDTGPIDKQKIEQGQKGWGETLSGGMLGGGGKK